MYVFVLKCESIKIDRLKNIKDGYDFSPAQGVLRVAVRVLFGCHCLALSPFAFAPTLSPLTFEMPETPYEVKARVYVILLYTTTNANPTSE